MSHGGRIDDVTLGGGGGQERSWEVTGGRVAHPALSIATVRAGRDPTHPVSEG